VTSTPDWLSREEALERILRVCPLLPEQRLHVSTDAADLGPDRAVSHDVTAIVDHPPWNNSAMDGFAVRLEDVVDAGPGAPVSLPISDDIPAGSFPSQPLRPGTVARVMTGAPVPEGSTGVIRIEHTDGGPGGTVRIDEASDAARNIRRQGEDLARGDIVGPPGGAATPAVLGCLAMQGIETITVRRRPRIGVLANGDELADFDRIEEVRAGRKIMNSNSHALAAQLREVGAKPVDLGIASDDTEAVRAALERGAECDAIVSTAGVSVGDHDHVKIRPGSPMTFGLLGGRPFWGLPGNPVSAMVTFEVFLRPAIRKMAGHTTLHRRTIPARARESFASRAELTHFSRVRLSRADDGTIEAALTGPQGSGILTSMAAADGLAVIPEGASEIPAGAFVDVILLRDTVQ
jgi:molybdopterin molybdotransferase